MTDRPITDRPGFWYRGFTYVLLGDPLIAEETMPMTLERKAEYAAEYHTWKIMVDAFNRPRERPLFLPRFVR